MGIRPLSETVSEGRHLVVYLSYLASFPLEIAYLDAISNNLFEAVRCNYECDARRQSRSLVLERDTRRLLL